MRFAIFNGFPFHYEVFGGFIQYCKNFGHELTIFTSKHNSDTWFSFYQTCFSPYSFTIRDMIEFTPVEYNKHDFIIVTTDDDYAFRDQFMMLPDAQNKVISYDHSYRNRRPIIKKHIGIRPYLRSRPEMKVFYPVYEMISKEEKYALLNSSKTIHISIVGGLDHSAKFLNNIDLKNTHVTYIRRSIPNEKKEEFKKVCPSIEFIENCPTNKMIDCVKRSHYLFILIDNDNYTFNATSGAVGLVFSAGCQLVMPRKNNIEYKFKSALYFEDLPKLGSPDIDAVFKEREEILSKNYTNFDGILRETYGSHR